MPHSSPRGFGRGPHVRIARGHEVVLTELRYGKLAGSIRIEMARTVGTGELLFVDLALKRHEGVDKRLGPWRTTGDVDIDGDVTVDALEDVVALLERPAANRARAHCDDVLGLRHLVVETHDLRSHLLGHRAGHDHEVRLSRRRTKDFCAEAGKVVTGHARGDHLDGATGEAELKRPDGVLAAPVVEFLHLRGEDALLAEFAAESFVHQIISK